METETPKKYCFDGILRWLTIFALPIEPLNMSNSLKILYYVYCVTFLILFPVGYVVSQTLQVPYVIDDLKLVSCILGYVFSDTLGKYNI